MKEYYDARAPEYDEWYLDEGQYAARERMLEIASERVPKARFVQGDATDLGFEDGAFDRVFTGHWSTSATSTQTSWRPSSGAGACCTPATGS
jgi:methyltransferase family protein